MINDQKQELRTNLERICVNISKANIEAASEAVTEAVLNELKKMPVSKKANVYRMMPKWAEIDTREIVAAMENQFGYEKVDQPSATPSAMVPTEKYDVIILPCLGFDSNCNRIGRGAGWYDKFLATQPQAFKVGLAFEALRCSKIPVESHDVRLDMVITEKAIYSSHGKPV